MKGSKEPVSKIQRTYNVVLAEATYDVGVYHRRTDIFVSQKFLNRADIDTGLKHMGGVGVAESVCGNLFGYSCFLYTAALILRPKVVGRMW